MFRSIYTAASGMYAQQQNMDEITENLANAETTGYKKGRVDFEDLVYSAMAEPGALGAYGEAVPVSSEVGAGVRPASIQKLFSSGQLYHTGNALDIGIQGDGFIQVKLEDGGLGYTRNGALRINKEGELLAGGRPVAGVKLPQNSQAVEILQDGTIKAFVKNPKEKEVVGQIKLARFLNPAGLRNIDNAYVETPISGLKVEGLPGQTGLGEIRSGYIEKANVNIVEEMMNIVLAQRTYEFNSKAVQASDEMMRQTTQLQPK